MKEVDVFDATYTRHLGTAPLRQVYEEGLWHQSAHAWIFTSDEEIIFQLRSNDIVSYPNRLGVSAGGCVDVGDTPFETIIRETQEELGLNISDEKILSVGYRICQSSNEGRIYNVFDNLFLINHEAPLIEYNIQESEVGGVFAMSYADAAKFFNNEIDNVELRGFTIENGERKWRDIVARLDSFVPFKPYYYKHMLGIIGRMLNAKAHSYVFVGNMFQNYRKIMPVPMLIQSEVI
ncbi:MAG: NUDIX domain-containing protein [Lactobacillaceae bacterium]|jgi:8-oxo-dGTP pyrophosphatase MutT (NUDIX family)|nr:NUDIX domain-containing protein [Lactobacillaceae bacterium]